MLFICSLLLRILSDFIINMQLPPQVVTSWEWALGGDNGMDSADGLLVILYWLFLGFWYLIIWLYIISCGTWFDSCGLEFILLYLRFISYDWCIIGHITVDGIIYIYMLFNGKLIPLFISCGQSWLINYFFCMFCCYLIIPCIVLLRFRLSDQKCPLGPGTISGWSSQFYYNNFNLVSYLITSRVKSGLLVGIDYKYSTLVYHLWRIDLVH